MGAADRMSDMIGNQPTVRAMRSAIPETTFMSGNAGIRSADVCVDISGPQRVHLHTAELSETTITAGRNNGMGPQGPRAEAITLPGCPTMIVDYPAPLPGIIIFVHGVNSTGEWFDTAEEGICRGLNTRLQRADEHVFRVEGSGQRSPVTYMS